MFFLMQQHVHDFFFFLILLFNQTKNKQKLVYIQCLEDMIIMSLQSFTKRFHKGRNI